MVLALTLIFGSAVNTFGASTSSNNSVTANTTTASAITATSSAITTTSGGAVSAVTDGAITTTTPAIEGVTLPQLTDTKTLSLADAIKIMKTTGASAETADLHKQSDIAVGKGYSETVSKIKKTQDNLDALSEAPDSWVQANYGESVVQMAYDAQVAGVTSNNKKVMQLRRDFAKDNTENNYQAELNQIEADTTSLYYKVLLAQDKFKIAQDNLTSQKKTLQNVEAKKAAGMLSKKDVLQAESAVADAESEVRSAETQMKYAKMSFNYLLGYNVQQNVVFTDSLETVAAAAEIESADKAVQNALNNRIELKGANFAINVYQILFNDVSIYPKNSSTYLNAKINLAESQKTAKDAYSKIEIDVRNKYDLVQDKRAAVAAAKDLLTYATEGERLVELTNEEGMSTVEELLATQVSVYKAKLNLANANSEYAIALKNYDFAQGVGTTRISL